MPSVQIKLHKLKCRCCLTTDGPLSDRKRDDQIEMEMLYITKMNFIFKSNEFNITGPFMLCTACGKDVEVFFKFKVEISAMRNISNADYPAETDFKKRSNRICSCCLAKDDLVKLEKNSCETEFIDNIKLYFNDTFDVGIVSNSGDSSELCIKCEKMLTKFSVFKQKLIRAIEPGLRNTDTNMDTTVEYKIESTIDIKEELSYGYDSANYVSGSGDVNDVILKSKQYLPKRGARSLKPQIRETAHTEKTKSPKKSANTSLHKCQHCGKEFIHRYKLVSHLISHSEEKKYKCQLCDARFKDVYTRNRHLLSHTGEKPYACPQCDKRFTRKSAIKLHTAIHVGEKRHKCPECDKPFIHRKNMKKHLLIHSREKKSFKCQHCEKKFHRKDALTRHLFNHEKSHECLICGKRYGYKHNLKRHLQTHPAERPFPCDFCDRGFYDATALKEHLAIHVGDSKFICLQCGKRFPRKTILATHLLIHNGEKTYNCQHCDKCYTAKYTLEMHLLKKHKHEKRTIL